MNHAHPSFVSDFNLSLTAAMRTQLLAALDALVPVPLSEEALVGVRHAPGVYELFLDRELVYVGKAKSDLQSRLRQHARKLSGRRGELLARVTFRAVYVAEDLDSIAPERMLIEDLRKQGLARWNFNGFGNKDPGRNRDRSLVDRGHFDALFPVNTDVLLALEPQSGQRGVRELLSDIKRASPFLFRYDVEAVPDVDVEHGCVTAETRTFRDWLTLAVEVLPRGWLGVVLPGYVILYREADASVYSSRLGSVRRLDGGAVWEEHLPDFALPAATV